MKHLLFILLLSTANSEAIAQSPPRYAVTDLSEKLLPSTTTAYAINDKTEIVGVVDGHPFLWRKGSLQLLGFNGVPKAINNRSQIVGMLDLQPGSTVKSWLPAMRGFLYQNGTLRNLGVLPGGVFSSEARAINAKGEIVGYSSANYLDHAILFKQGKMVDLGVPLGFEASGSTGINSAGQVVGAVKTSIPRISRRGFLWENNKWKILPANVFPVTINDNGTLLCRKSISNAKRTTLTDNCLLWKMGVPKTIGEFQPKAINNSEQVVGVILPNIYSGPRTFGNPTFGNPKPLPPSVAVLWESGHLWHLNDLIAKTQGWQITSAEAINNRGEIVGQGIHNGKVCAVLLTPLIK